MVKENISVKFLIHLVGERPALWDKTSEDYKDRKLKETSWREICAFVNENFFTMPPRARDEFSKMIMKKWTHIRDSWVKSMKYGYDEITKIPPKPYVYHNELKFMQKILKCKPRRYNLNLCQPSNTHFEEFYREKNETQNSIGSSHDADNDNGGEDNEADVDFKQEPNATNNETKVTVANEEESDDWHFEDTEIVSAIEKEDDKQNELVKRKRRSIFVSARNEEEYNEQKEEPVLQLPSKIIKMPTLNTPPIPPKISAIENASVYQQSHHSVFHENRHWNFFQGILPSTNSLDEDHVLQFQSGVISLLQKLRESQKQKQAQTQKPKRLSSHSLFKGRGRKRKASLDDDDDDWEIRNYNSKRKAKRYTADPIAPEDGGPDTEYSSDN